MTVTAPNARTASNWRSIFTPTIRWSTRWATTAAAATAKTIRSVLTSHEYRARARSAFGSGRLGRSAPVGPPEAPAGRLGLRRSCRSGDLSFLGVVVHVAHSPLLDGHVFDAARAVVEGLAAPCVPMPDTGRRR